MVVHRHCFAAILAFGLSTPTFAQVAEYQNREDLLLLLSIRRESNEYRDFLLQFRGLTSAAKDYRSDPSLRERIIYSKETGIPVSRRPVTYAQYMEDRSARLSTLSRLGVREVYDGLAEVLPLPGVGRYLLPDSNVLDATSRDAAASPTELVKQIDLAAKDPELRKHLQKAFKAKFGVDIGSDLSAVTDVAAAKAKLATDVLTRDQQGIRAEISSQAASIDKLSKDLRAVLADERAQRISAIEAENRRKQIVRDGEDAAAGLRLAGFVAEWTGNRRLADFAFAAADRTAGLFDLVSRKGDMSGFAFGVSMLYQVNGIGALMKGSAEPAEVQMLRALMQQVAALREEMAARFDNLTDFIGSFWRHVDTRFDRIEAILRDESRLNEMHRANLNIEFEAVNAGLSRAYTHQFVLADEARRNSQQSLHLEVDADVANVLTAVHQARAPLIEKLNSKIVVYAENTSAPPFVTSASEAMSTAGGTVGLNGSGNAYVPMGVFASGASVLDERATQLLGTTATHLPFNVGAWLDLSRNYRRVASKIGDPWFKAARVEDTDRLIAVGERAKRFQDFLFPPQGPRNFWPAAIASFERARSDFAAEMEKSVRATPGQFSAFDLSEQFGSVEAQERKLPYVGAMKTAHYCSDFGFILTETDALSDAERIRWREATFPLPTNLDALIPWELRLAERVKPETHSIQWCVNPSKLIWRKGSRDAMRAFLLVGTVKSSIFHSEYSPTINRIVVKKKAREQKVQDGRLVVSVAVIPQPGKLDLGSGNWAEKQKTINDVWMKSINNLDLRAAWVSAVDGFIENFTTVTAAQPQPNEEFLLAKEFAERCVIAERAKLDSPEERAFCASNRLASSILFFAQVSHDKILSLPTVMEQEEYRLAVLNELRREFVAERGIAFQNLRASLKNPTFQELGGQITLSATLLRAACLFAFVEQCLEDRQIQEVFFSNGPFNGYDNAVSHISSDRRLSDESFFFAFEKASQAAVQRANAATRRLTRPAVAEPINDELKRLRRLRAQQIYWRDKGRVGG